MVPSRARFWSVIGVLAIVLPLALLAAGCGSSSSSASTSTSPSASSAATVTVAGIAIKEVSTLHQLLPASVLTSGQIKVGVDLPYAPWGMYVGGNTSDVTGFEPNLLQAIGAVLGVKVTFHQLAWSSVILSVQGGKNDIVLTDMNDTLAREQQVTFVDYAYDATAILVLKGDPQGITSLDSLAGKSVACEEGSSQQSFLQSLNTQFKNTGKKQMQLIVLPGQSDCWLALKGGRVAAALSDYSVLNYMSKTTNNGNTFEVVVDPSAPRGYDPSLIGCAMAKTNTQLITAVQKALQELINNGAYTAIINKYGLLPVKSAQINGTALTSNVGPTP